MHVEYDRLADAVDVALSDHPSTYTRVVDDLRPLITTLRGSSSDWNSWAPAGVSAWAAFRFIPTRLTLLSWRASLGMPRSRWLMISRLQRRPSRSPL